MTKEDAFKEINYLQDGYIDELIQLLISPDYEMMKMINFTSATGTGKTKMMSKLINRLSNFYFIITTLSKGQLNIQIKNNLSKDCQQNNYIVYGSADYRINSRLDAEDIISKIPENTKCIWLRDEGHIATNRWDDLLLNVCYKVVNFSATNQYSDIKCNFAQTMMLRTVNQTTGTPEDAINKLLEVKKKHAQYISKDKYNPCAIFRCVSGDTTLYNRIIDLCENNGLKYIDITEDTYNMAELCEDDNEYDVLINKFKIVEGIDIRRSHILYMDNEPNNVSTTIQVIGRCRRNALLYSDDIDILAPENEQLLKDTRECYVFYNVEKMKVDEDINGELQIEFCDHISCEMIKPNSIVSVNNGKLSNGLIVIELKGYTGNFKIIKDEKTGFNIVEPITDFYKEQNKLIDSNYLYVSFYNHSIAEYDYRKIKIQTMIDEFEKFTSKIEYKFDYSVGERKPFEVTCDPYYKITPTYGGRVNIMVDDRIIQMFQERKTKYSKEYLYSILTNFVEVKIRKAIKNIVPIKHNRSEMENYINQFIKDFENKSGYKQICKYLKENNVLEETLIIKYYVAKLKKEKINQLDIDNFREKVSITDLEYYDIDDGFKKKPIFTNEEKISIIQLFFEYYFSQSNKSIIKEIEQIDMWTIKTKDIIPISPIAIYTDLNDYYSNYKDCSTTKLPLQEAKKAINTFFEKLDKEIYDLSISKHIYSSIDFLIKYIYNRLEEEENFLKSNAFYMYIDDRRYELCLPNELIFKKDFYIWNTIDESNLLKLKRYKKYNKTINDKESAIIGTDLMYQTKDAFGNKFWVESSSISSKVKKYCKLNSYISKRYINELKYAKKYYFSGNNDFNFDKRVNSIIGYCVEYYSKYLIYGESYLYPFIDNAKRESNTNIINNAIIIRACMLKYRMMMLKCFGQGVAKLIQTISITTLIQSSYMKFVNLVVKLGTKTADFVKETLYQNQEPKDDIDPNLSIRHITGLADYITEDTILDVKVQNHIDETMIKQVLAYHYLSTKRSDLHIKRVIVYDATSDKSITINIGEYDNEVSSNNDIETIVNHIGETNITKNGQKMTIISFRGYGDIDIQFDNEEIIRHQQYGDFINGTIKYKKQQIKTTSSIKSTKEKQPISHERKSTKKDRVGESRLNNQGLNMTIVNYRGSNDLDVQFDDGTIIEYRKYDHFKNGKIKNPNFKKGFLC